MPPVFDSELEVPQQATPAKSLAEIMVIVFFFYVLCEKKMARRTAASSQREHSQEEDCGTDTNVQLRCCGIVSIQACAALRSNSRDSFQSQFLK